MLQLVEMTGMVNERGCIEIPVAALVQMGIVAGQEVSLIYISEGEGNLLNQSREFILAKANENPLGDLLKEENVELKLPPELLADANIPIDADIDIICTDRKIVIVPSEDVDEPEIPEEWMGIFAELGIPREKVNVVLHVVEDEVNEKGRL